MVEIDELKKENQLLIKQGVMAASGLTPRKDQSSASKPTEGGENMRKYQKFLEKRIQECMEENKRHLAKYSDLRVFAYTQIENLVKKHNAISKMRGRYGGAAPNAALNNSSMTVYK